ncbi:HAD family hydrolase [Flavobacterium silvaticum]|uniref:HAD family hydrolase n=1 Tax=Flavobacterium silvaticum TaxID=1852020 RepID=A0A972JIX6_9FLAO|nr:HAD family hydrolase [Flavobacterium silvaticum]NMH29520.1 HAD family hydrolase [Flavobacterium silvaticum]
MKYLLLDVAGTLLHKPVFYEKVHEVLNGFGYEVPLETLKLRHKTLSEAIFFPDRTSADFYRTFNAEFMYSLGIVPSDLMLETLFTSCSYLPWEKFEDTKILETLNCPIGIISNFNSTLKDKLKSFFHVEFKDILVSEELGVAKPKAAFYQAAIDRIGLEPKDILYVGDSVKLDLEPAHKLGINAFLIDRDNYFPAQPSRLGSLSELKKFV